MTDEVNEGVPCEGVDAVPGDVATTEEDAGALLRDATYEECSEYVKTPESGRAMRCAKERGYASAIHFGYHRNIFFMRDPNDKRRVVMCANLLVESESGGKTVTADFLSGIEGERDKVIQVEAPVSCKVSYDLYMDSGFNRINKVINRVEASAMFSFLFAFVTGDFKLLPCDYQTVRADDNKVGRNEPCPCGSGRKYKKCCLRG